MKKLMFLLFALSFSGLTMAQIIDLGTSVQHGDITVADTDADGDLDIVVSGDENGVKKLGYFINEGSMTFSEQTNTAFVPVSHTAEFGWADYDLDGDLDAIESGWKADGAFAGVFSNDGSGTFSLTSVEVPQVAPTSGWGNFNNDAYPDMYVFGNGAGTCKLFFNNGDGTFTENTPFENFNWVDPEASLVDYDNDGDVDIFITGWDDVNATRYSKIFVNTDGSFAEQDLGLLEKGYGSATWGDYDNDGDPDLLLNGDGGAGSGEESSDIYRLYKNTGGAFSEAATFSTFRQISVGDGGRFADWDNDGDLDIIVSGWSGNLGRQAVAIFTNEGGDTFSELTAATGDIPGVSESSIEVADLDNDMDLDLLISGFSGNQGAPNTYDRNINIIYTNAASTPNTAPMAPTGLSASVEGSDVTLSWNPASDNQTASLGLNYNFYIKNQSSGEWVVFPNADISTGKRMVTGLGNAYQNTEWIVKNLPDGTYQWSVQAIDAGYAGSEFATAGSFQVGSTSVEQVQTEKLNVYPNPVRNGRVFVNANAEEIKSAELIALDGRIVKTFMPRQNQLNVSEIGEGVYILRIETAKNVQKMKLIIW